MKYANLITRLSLALAVFKNPTSVRPSRPFRDERKQINWLKRALAR